MAQQRFDMGESVDIYADFRTSKKAVPPSQLVDPATITLVIRRPDKTTETRTYGGSGITKLETGRYSAPLLLSQEGTYRWRWTGTGGPNQVGVVTGSLDSVREPNF